MRKWYKKRGGYVYLPRIPWIKRPTWYRQPPRRYDPYKPRPWHLPIIEEPLPPLPEWAQKEIEKSKVKSAIGKKHRIKRVTTIPMTPDQKKLLETTKPKKSRKKRVQSPKGALPTRNPRTTQLESQEQTTQQEIGQEMPRVRQKYRVRTPRAVFRGRRPRTVLRRNLRPRRPKNRMMQSVKPTGAGSTYSYYREPVRYRNFRRKMMLLSPKQRQFFTQGERCEWVYRNQGIINFVYQDRGDILTWMNNIPSFGDATVAFLRNMNSELTFSNQSNANCFIYIYNYQFKRDCNQSMEELIDAGLNDVFTGVKPTSQTYGITPSLASTTTKLFFRITKVTKIELGAGRSHVHNQQFEWNKMWNNQLYPEVNLNNYGGWTKGAYIIMKGEPVNDITDKTKVVPSSGAVDIVRRDVLTYYYAEPKAQTLEYIVGLPTGDITENIMESATDQASALEKA